MSAWVILNAEPDRFSPAAQRRWQAQGRYLEGDPLDPALAAQIIQASVLIVRLKRYVGCELLDRLPALKVVVSATTGHDHIDTAELERRGIRLLSLRGEDHFLGGIPSTAEHAWGLLLALLRNIPAANEAVRAGGWDRDRFRGRQLKGRRLGLVGLGRTGGMVAGYAAAFGMEVAYYDPAVADPRYRRFERLEELLGWAEIVSLHLHLTSASENLLGAACLEALAPGACLVNTSRGRLLDEAHAAALLRAGRIAGIASDVLAGELGDLRASPLWQAQRDGFNVVLTPHLGGATTDAMQACEEFMADKFRRLVAADGG